MMAIEDAASGGEVQERFRGEGLLPCPFCGAPAKRVHMSLCCDVSQDGCGAITMWPICSVTTHAERLWNTRTALKSRGD